MLNQKSSRKLAAVLVFTALLYGCHKKTGETCTTCSAQNSSGTVLQTVQVCDEAEEDAFRQDYADYLVQCE